MGRITKEYIASQNIGDRQALVHEMKALHTELKKLYQEKKIAAFELALLNNSDDISDELLEVDKVLEISKGVFPLLFISLSYQSEQINSDDLVGIENSHHLELVASASDALS